LLVCFTICIGPRVGNMFCISCFAMRRNRTERYKPKKKVRQSFLKPAHKTKRVSCSKYLLRKYDSWDHHVFTDFSAPIKLKPDMNKQNAIAWVPESCNWLDLPPGAIHDTEKFSYGCMVWGGISSRGLVPKERPIFVTEFLQNSSATTMTSSEYVRLLHDFAEPAVRRLYPKQTGRSGRRDFARVVWQDDGASIHRTGEAKEAVRKLFRNRIKTNKQSAKMDDVWPSEDCS